MAKDSQLGNVDLARRALIKSILGLFSILGAAFLYSFLRYLIPPQKINSSSKNETLTIPLNDLDSGSYLMVRFKGKPVVVVRTDNDGIAAISATCTHLGCIVKWHQDKNRLICPCHAATFDLSGKVLSGPAPKPLPVYPAKISNGKILIG